MMTVYDLKTRFQKLLRPIVNTLATHNITANQITIAAMLLSFFLGLFLVIFPNAHWPFLLLPLGLLIRMALNAIDGMLAKEHGMQSSLGTFLNELGDVFSDVFIYLPFSLVPGIFAPWVVIFVILAIITEFTGIVSVQIGHSRCYQGPLGKSDRAFFMALISLLLGLGVETGVWINLVFIALCILAIITIIKRTLTALEGEK